AITQGADPHEVTVTFRRPYAEWRSLFGPLYPAAETSTAAAFNRALTGAGHPGAGPYTLDRYDAEGGRISLVRNPLWWGDRPKSHGLDSRAAPPARGLAGLAQDRLDAAPLTAAVDRAVPAPPSGSPSAAAAPPAAAPEAAALALRRAESLPGVTVHR